MKTGKQHPSVSFSRAIQRKEPASGTRLIPPDHGVQTIVQRKSSSDKRQQTPVSQAPIQRVGWLRRTYNKVTSAGRSILAPLLGTRTEYGAFAANTVKHAGQFGGHVANVMEKVGYGAGGLSVALNAYGGIKNHFLNRRLKGLDDDNMNPASRELLQTALEESSSNRTQNAIGAGLATAGIVGAATGIGAPLTMPLVGLGSLGLMAYQGYRRYKRAKAQSELEAGQSSILGNFLSPGLRSMTAIKKDQLGAGNIDPELTHVLDRYQDFGWLGRDRGGEREPLIDGGHDLERGLDSGPRPFPLESDDDRSSDSDSDSPPPSPRPMSRITEPISGGPEAQVNPYAVVPLPTLPLHPPQQRPAPIEPLPEVVVAPPQVVAPLPQPLPQPQPIPVQQPDPQAARIAEDMHKARSINFWNRPN